MDIYRNQDDATRFHIHVSGSNCSACWAKGIAAKEVEMPKNVYGILADKFNSRGYIVAPEDTGNNESTNDWWTVVRLLLVLD